MVTHSNDNYHEKIVITEAQTHGPCASNQCSESSAIPLGYPVTPCWELSYLKLDTKLHFKHFVLLRGQIRLLTVQISSRIVLKFVYPYDDTSALR